MICEQCRGPIENRRSDARYCSQSCARKMERIRLQVTGLGAERSIKPSRRLARAESSRRWRSNNPDKARVHHQTRRARKLSSPGDGVSSEQWDQILAWSNHRCAYCKSGRDLQEEHVIPLSRGGWHDVSNVVPACATCNNGPGGKFAKTAEEWMPDWRPPPWIVIRPTS